MSQSSSEKFLCFTVGLLKDSEALESLRQDAVKHHMIDNPGQLIALRLTEYYEMMNKGIVQPAIRVPALMTPVEPEIKPKVAQRSSVQSRAAMEPAASYSSIEIDEPVLPTRFSSISEPTATSVSQVTGRMRALMKEGDGIVPTSNNAEQNADEAADYWSVLE